MPNERTTIWGRRGVALLPALSGKVMADLREGIRLLGFCFAEEKEPKTSVWFFSFWDIGVAGWATRACKQWVSVECLFITGCHENKAVVIESVIWDTPSSSQIKWAEREVHTNVIYKPVSDGSGWHWLDLYMQNNHCVSVFTCFVPTVSSLLTAWHVVMSDLSKCCTITREGLKEICHTPHLYSYPPPQKIAVLMWKNTSEMGDS